MSFSFIIIIRLSPIIIPFRVKNQFYQTFKQLPKYINFLSNLAELFKFVPIFTLYFILLLSIFFIHNEFLLLVFNFMIHCCTALQALLIEPFCIIQNVFTSFIIILLGDNSYNLLLSCKNQSTYKIYMAFWHLINVQRGNFIFCMIPFQNIDIFFFAPQEFTKIKLFLQSDSLNLTIQRLKGYLKSWYSMQKQIEYSHHYNGFITKNGNYVWAGAMCLAWNQLILSFVKEPIKLATEDKKVLQMIENYNSAKFKATDINPQSIYVKSGKGQQTVDLINKEVKQKFPEKSFKDLEFNLQNQDIISYAYLFKKLQFKTKFNRISQKNFMFNDIQCQSFYAKSKQQKQQIFYSYYKDKENFTISIASKNANDYIFFVKRQGQITVQQVIQACNQQKLKKIDKDDNFQMPVVQLQTKRDINQLKLQLLNKSMAGYKIDEIYQGIKLKIDESGAKVQNEAVIMLLQCKAMKKNQPKYFILNRSFWVCMKQKNKHPYLCAYISNPTDKS